MHYLGEVKTFIIICGKFTQDKKSKILSESAWFCRRREQKHLVCFLGSQFHLLLTYKMQMVSFTGSVATLFRWAGRCLNYCIKNWSGQCVPNFIRIEWALWKVWQKHFGVFFGPQCTYAEYAGLPNSYLRCARLHSQYSVCGWAFRGDRQTDKHSSDFISVCPMSSDNEYPEKQSVYTTQSNCTYDFTL